jgi:RNA polymerase sigma-70 factor (family 1)
MTDYTEFTDHKLLELMAQDDHVAFNTIYNRYWSKVLNLATHKTGDIMEAENIIQDIFVSLWKRRHSLIITNALENFLFVSVKYRVIKVLNTQRTERLYNETDGLTVDVLDDSTQQYLSFEELRQRLEMLIGKLPEQSRLIYRMNKEENMSYKAIAEKLDITERSVEAHLARAKKTLKTALGSFLTTFLL